MRAALEVVMDQYFVWYHMCDVSHARMRTGRRSQRYRVPVNTCSIIYITLFACARRSCRAHESIGLPQRREGTSTTHLDARTHAHPIRGECPLRCDAAPM